MTNRKKSKIPFSISVLESITYITKAIALGDLVGQEAFGEILQLATRITNADFGSIHLYDSKNKKLKVAIFINGCFWHNHNCKIGHIPKSNINFWKKKIENNIKRDSRIKKTLKAQGWKVIYVWECKINSNLNKYIKKLFTRILIN